jgi:hypothetical protein
MDYQNGVSQNVYLVSQSLEICISGCHFCLKTIIYNLKSPSFEFIVRNCCLKCGKIVRFDAVNFEKLRDFEISKSSFGVFENLHLIDTTSGICRGTVFLSDSLIAVSSVCLFVCL